MEKTNIAWQSNGTVSYTPIKRFYFNRELSHGDETDLVQQLNISVIVSIYSLSAVQFQSLQ